MQNLTTIESTEFQDLFDSADLKNGLKKIESPEQKISRFSAICAIENLKEANELFFNYGTEKSLSGKKEGFIIAFNKKFKSLFDYAVDNGNSTIQNDFVKIARQTITHNLKSGMNKKLTRKEIKKNCWLSLESLALAYKSINQ